MRQLQSILAADAIVWHDLECGSYDADLALFSRLAKTASGPVLELGCGTGRVALHLAADGHEVVGVDSDPFLLGALRKRAEERGLEVTTVEGDVCTLEDAGLQRACDLILAPMQLLQLMKGAERRRALLRAVASCLRPGGHFAAAIIEGPLEGEVEPDVLPDIFERDGHLFASLPQRVRLEGEAMLVERVRQHVDPDGRLAEQPHTDRLELVTAAGVEREGRAAGLNPVRRERLADTDLHVGSTVLVMEGPGA